MNPDITMCRSKDCPRHKRCYRHEAKPSDYQSYFAEDDPCAALNSEMYVLWHDRSKRFNFFMPMTKKEGKK